MIGRNEADQRFKQLRDLIDISASNISDIRNIISLGEGSSIQGAKSKQQSNWLIALIIGSIISGFGLIVSIAALLIVIMRK